MKNALVALATLAVALPAGFNALAQGTGEVKDATTLEIEKYRQMLSEDNPAELYEAKGEEIWKRKGGPKGASLEKCDLGLGPGVVKGAYVQMPRYFADVNKVQDLETRLVHCMVTLQGMTVEEVTKEPFDSDNHKTDLNALVAYAVGASKGMTIDPQLKHPKEKEMAELGKRIFNYRAGPYDFSCATCHAENGRRIRLQDLPNLTVHVGAQRAYGSWPAYRISEGLFRSMQWRINDCFRQQRFPEPKYGSDTVTALLSFMASTAAGGKYEGPGFKR